MADVTIESIAIEITATAEKADKALEKLSASLEKLKAVCQSGLDGADKSAKNLRKIAEAAQSFENVNAEKLASVARALQSFENIANLPDLSRFARSISSVASAASGINSTDMNALAANMQGFAAAVQPLSALQGMGDISNAINAMGKLPNVAKKLSQMDIGTFARQMQEVTAAVQPFITQIQSLVTSFASVPEPIQRAVAALINFTDTADRSARSSKNLNKVLSFANLTSLYLTSKKIIGMFSQFVTTSNEYVENLNLFMVTMGDATDEALKFANTVNSLMGIDVSQWIQNQGIFKQMTSGFGMVEEKANLLSKNLTQLGFDISSYYNISVESAMQKLQSGLAGEIMPLRSLGYALDQATLKQVALNHGIETSITDMSQAQKAQLRYIAIMEQSKNAMGDMARTIDSPANQLRILESRIQTLKRAIGDSLMPVISAALPYVTAFVQILGETFRSIAEFMGFELPVFDYSDLTKGTDSITEGFEEATAASNKFKGTLAGIDQLNIIGSKSETSGTGDLFGDLNLDLPSYDFLGNLQEETSKAYDTLKKFFKDAIPWIGAIGGALLGLKIAKSPLLTQLSSLAQNSSALGKLSGVIGGLISGGISAFLLKGGIKNLISGDGNIGLNIAETVAGGLVGGVSLAKFVKSGNKWGAALTAGLVSYGITSGILSGWAKKVENAGKKAFESSLYNNGGTKITEIATAYEKWATAAINVNKQTIEKYSQLGQYDDEMGNLRDTMTEIAGIDLKLDEITPADAEKLKAPFDSLVGYLQDDFKSRVEAAAQSVAEAFSNLNLSEGINAEMQASFKTMERLFDTTLSDTQKVVDEYLDRISQGQKLTDAEMADFTQKYNYVFNAPSGKSAELKELERTIDEINLSKIDLEDPKYAVDALEKIQAASEAYVQSAKERYRAEIDNLDVLREQVEYQYKNRDITGMTLEEYNSQMGLIDLSENLFGLNYQKQIGDVRQKIEDITGAVNLQLEKSAKDAVASGKAKATWNEWVSSFFTGDLGYLDSVVKGRLLGESDAYDLNTTINRFGAELETTVKIHDTYADESTAQSWAIMLKEQQPNIDVLIGRIQDDTGQFKYIVGDAASLLDAQIDQIRDLTGEWQYVTGETQPEIKAKMVEFYDATGILGYLTGEKIAEVKLAVAEDNKITNILASDSNLETYGAALGGAVLVANALGAVDILETPSSDYEDTFRLYFSDVLSRFNDNHDKLEEIGGYLMEGLAKGIFDDMSLVYSAIDAVSRGAIDEVKEICGIASPSKVFAEIGGFLMKGLAVGIDKNEMFVLSALDDTAYAMQHQMNGIEFDLPVYTEEDIQRRLSKILNPNITFASNGNAPRYEGADPQQVAEVSNIWSSNGQPMVVNVNVQSYVELDGEQVGQATAQYQQRQMAFSNGKS